MQYPSKIVVVEIALAEFLIHLYYLPFCVYIWN